MHGQRNIKNQFDVLQKQRRTPWRWPRPTLKCVRVAKIYKKRVHQILINKKWPGGEC